MILRAVVKGIALYGLFVLLYQAWQSIQSGALPTLYNTLVPGQTRIAFNFQRNLPMLLNNHIIQRATSETWNIVMLGSSETHGGPNYPDEAIPAAMDRLALVTAAGQPVRVYNLAAPISDIWKDLFIADLLLRQGLPIDLIVVNANAYTFGAVAPHVFLVHNPREAAELVAPYGLNPDRIPSIPARLAFMEDSPSLLAWAQNQMQSPLWALTRVDVYRKTEVEGIARTALTERHPDIPITRPEFMIALRRLSEAHGIPVLLINVPRPYREDPFALWVREAAAGVGLPLLDCGQVYRDEPSIFYDHIHMLSPNHARYARVLAWHLSQPEMSAVAPALPLRLPQDFVREPEMCSFYPPDAPMSDS